MEKYRNPGGDSGVSSFEIGSAYITVKLSGSFRTYRYSYKKAGQQHVKTMRRLSRSGSGFNSYTNRYVKIYTIEFSYKIMEELIIQAWQNLKTILIDYTEKDGINDVVSSSENGTVL